MLRTPQCCHFQYSTRLPLFILMYINTHSLWWCFWKWQAVPLFSPTSALFPLINMEHATYFCRCIWWQKETSLSPWSMSYQKRNGFPCQVHGVINLGKWPGSDCKILPHRRLFSILLSNQYQCPETGLKLDSYSVNLLMLSGSWAWHGHILRFLNDVVEIPMVIVRLLFDQVFSLPMYGNIKAAPT